MQYPITTLINSVACTKKYTLTIPRPVKCAKTNANGTMITQVNAESNKNVTTVFPPERKVK